MRPEAECGDNGLYVIDKEYRIVHFNQLVKSSFPEIACGALCYNVFCGEYAPCRECPLSKEGNRSTILYNKLLHRWLECSTAVGEWPGKGLCNFVFTRRIDEGNKNLFYNLTSLSVYDELFELNITRNTYKILYHLKGKYMIPAEEGELDSMLEQVAYGEMIHPGDRDAFLKFWNLDNLLPRLGESGGNNVLRGEFRKRKTDGEYCWVAQIVVPLLQGDSGDRIVMCFIQDIDAQVKEDQWGRRKDGRQEDTLDVLTGLYKRSVFFREAQHFLAGVLRSGYCLMTIDIEHFKLFNSWYGEEEGDKLLADIGRHLQKVQESGLGIAGYIGEDDFCVILPREDTVLKELQEGILEYVKQYGNNAGFFPAFGLYAIEDQEDSVSRMYDRASIALATVKGNYGQRARWYDVRMKQEMEENLVMLSEVQKGLSNGEFTFYTQPKCNMATGRIVGMESLVRWIHPEKGIIPPKDFIPLLENNGFITNLDLYIWEAVCSKVQEWIRQGKNAVPVSVNVSRVDIYTLDVVQTFRDLVHKYGLEPRFLEIEITESAYAEDSQIITGVVEDLRKAGFTVLMDDFGSGYSSLNMLKDVNVDVLKIDMKFLEMKVESAGKGLGILEAIINMARLMGLRLIAEGVETREQMDFLLDAGCLYGQGYYFYRPMPVEKLESLLEREENIDFRGIKAKQMESLNVRELLGGGMFSEAVVNNILGGIAFYDVYEGQVEIICVNEQYYRVTGSNPVDLEAHRKEGMRYVYEDDRQKLLDIFGEAFRSPVNGGKGKVRRLSGKGNTLWVQLHVFFIKEQDGHRMYYASLSDVTEQTLREHKLESSQRALSAVVHISENDKAFMKLTEENRRTAASIFAQMSPGGMIGGYCEDGFPLYFANNEMVKLLGYDSYEELAEAISEKVINTIHPDDRERVAGDIGPRYYAGLEYTTTYRMPKKDGSWFWTLDKGRVICAEDGRLAIVSACTDISETMMAQQRLAEINARLLRQNQELHFLNYDMPGGYHRCADTPDYDFLYISNRFLEIFGYTREEIRERFQDKFMNMVHPEDRRMVKEGVEVLSKRETDEHLEYRMKGKNGYIWVLDQSIYLEYEGKTMLQGMVLDVSKEVALRNKMRLLMDHISENIVLARYKEDTISYEIIANGMYRDLGYTWQEYEKHLKEQKYEQMITDRDKKRIRVKLMDAIRDKGDFNHIFPIFLPQKGEQWINLNAGYIGEEEGSIVFLFTYGDVSDLKQQGLNEALAGVVSTDSLTGLFNRQTAIPRINLYLSSMQGETAALIMFDLDNFKLANDVFGHAYGDTMISDNARKLKQFFRREDIICRIGGDEFLILCKNIKEEDLINKLSRVVETMVVCCKNGNRDIRFSISAGYAMIPDQGTGFDELYRKADIALFAAKMEGKSSFRKYAPSMKEIRYELADRKNSGE